jgi:hypothetical protein
VAVAETSAEESEMEVPGVTPTSPPTLLTPLTLPLADDPEMVLLPALPASMPTV